MLLQEELFFSASYRIRKLESCIPAVGLKAEREGVEGDRPSEAGSRRGTGIHFLWLVDLVDLGTIFKQTYNKDKDGTQKMRPKCLLLV